MIILSSIDYTQTLCALYAPGNISPMSYRTQLIQQKNSLKIKILKNVILLDLKS